MSTILQIWLHRLCETNARLQMTSLIERKDPNTRYIALGALCTLCESADMASALQPALPQVVGCLSDADPGVKKRAIDLLVNVCDLSLIHI